MQELESRKPSIVQVPIKLVLEETNIPEDALPSDDKLLLPTFARLFGKDETLHVELIVRDPDEEEIYGLPSGLPDFNWHNRVTLPLEFSRDQIVRLSVRRSWTSSPSAVLYVRDPGGVYEELYLSFGPWSKNNPHYHIDALAKVLEQKLNVPVEYEEKPPEPEWPF